MRYVSGTALSASRGNDAVHGVVAQEGRIGRRLFWWCSWGGGGTGLAKSLIARSRVLGKKPPVMEWCERCLVRAAWLRPLRGRCAPCASAGRGSDSIVDSQVAVVHTAGSRARRQQGCGIAARVVPCAGCPCSKWRMVVVSIAHVKRLALRRARCAPATLPLYRHFLAGDAPPRARRPRHGCRRRAPWQAARRLTAGRLARARPPPLRAQQRAKSTRNEKFVERQGANVVPNGCDKRRCLR